MDSRYDRFLSIGATHVLRIFFEALVLIHHLFPTYTSLGGEISSVLGPIAVGGFLMISGYGLGVRLREAGAFYCRKLLTRRVPMMYCRLLITDILYLIPFFLIGNRFSDAASAVSSILYLPFMPQFVALSHWVYFIADLMVYYLVLGLFALLFYDRKNGHFLTLLAFTLTLALLIVVLSVINLKTGSSRYMRGALLFPIGFAIAGGEGEIFKKGITPIAKWAVFGALLSLGIVAFLFSEVKFLSEYVIPIPFALVAAVALMGCDPKGKVLRYFSGLVIGVYLSHEAYLRIFEYFCPNLNEWLRVLVVVLCAFITAALIDLIKRGVRHLLANRGKGKRCDEAAKSRTL